MRGFQKGHGGYRPKIQDKQIPVRVSGELKAQIDAEAARVGLPVSAWIRQALEAALKR